MEINSFHRIRTRLSLCKSRPGALMIRTVERVKKKRECMIPNQATLSRRSSGRRITRMKRVLLCVFSVSSLAHAKLLHVYSLFCSPRAQRMLDVFYLFRFVLTAFVITTWANNESEYSLLWRAKNAGVSTFLRTCNAHGKKRVLALLRVLTLRESCTQFRGHSRSWASWLRLVQRQIRIDESRSQPWLAKTHNFFVADWRHLNGNAEPQKELKGEDKYLQTENIWASARLICIWLHGWYKYFSCHANHFSFKCRF